MPGCWLRVTRISPTPPSSQAMTPPARIPPTQTLFARGPGAVGIGAFSSRGCVAHNMGGGD